MRVLIGYDGSGSADAALDDLSRAGLPREGQALVVTVGDVLVAPPEPGYAAAAPALAGRRGRDALATASARASEALRKAGEQASLAGARVRSLFPRWDVSAEGRPGAPAWTLLQRAAEWGRT